jgi:hypothetical protein
VLFLLKIGLFFIADYLKKKLEKFTQKTSQIFKVFNDYGIIIV